MSSTVGLDSAADKPERAAAATMNMPVSPGNSSSSSSEDASGASLSLSQLQQFVSRSLPFLKHIQLIQLSFNEQLLFEVDMRMSNTEHIELTESAALPVSLGGSAGSVRLIKLHVQEMRMRVRVIPATVLSRFLALNASHHHRHGDRSRTSTLSFHSPVLSMSLPLLAALGVVGTTLTPAAQQHAMQILKKKLPTSTRSYLLYSSSQPMHSATFALSDRVQPLSAASVSSPHVDLPATTNWSDAASVLRFDTSNPWVEVPMDAVSSAPLHDWASRLFSALQPWSIDSSLGSLLSSASGVLECSEVDSVHINTSSACTSLSSGPMQELLAGRVFIGFATAQRTGCAFHLDTHLIPTVERENIDFQDPVISRWNEGMLQMAGQVARLVYEHRMLTFNHSLRVLGSSDELLQQATGGRSRAMHRYRESVERDARDWMLVHSFQHTPPAPQVRAALIAGFTRRSNNSADPSMPLLASTCVACAAKAQRSWRIVDSSTVLVPAASWPFERFLLANYSVLSSVSSQWLAALPDTLLPSLTGTSARRSLDDIWQVAVRTSVQQQVFSLAQARELLRTLAALPRVQYNTFVLGILSHLRWWPSNAPEETALGVDRFASLDPAATGAHSWSSCKWFIASSRSDALPARLSTPADVLPLALSSAVEHSRLLLWQLQPLKLSHLLQHLLSVEQQMLWEDEAIASDLLIYLSLKSHMIPKDIVQQLRELLARKRCIPGEKLVRLSSAQQYSDGSEQNTQLSDSDTRALSASCSSLGATSSPTSVGNPLYEPSKLYLLSPYLPRESLRVSARLYRAVCERSHSSGADHEWRKRLDAFLLSLGVQRYGLTIPSSQEASPHTVAHFAGRLEREMDDVSESELERMREQAFLPALQWQHWNERLETPHIFHLVRPAEAICPSLAQQLHADDWWVLLWPEDLDAGKQTIRARDILCRRVPTLSEIMQLHKAQQQQQMHQEGIQAWQLRYPALAFLVSNTSELIGPAQMLDGFLLPCIRPLASLQPTSSSSLRGGWQSRFREDLARRNWDWCVPMECLAKRHATLPIPYLIPDLFPHEAHERLHVMLNVSRTVLCSHVESILRHPSVVSWIDDADIAGKSAADGLENFLSFNNVTEDCKALLGSIPFIVASSMASRRDAAAQNGLAEEISVFPPSELFLADSPQDAYDGVARLPGWRSTLPSIAVFVARLLPLMHCSGSLRKVLVELGAHTSSTQPIKVATLLLDALSAHGAYFASTSAESVAYLLSLQSNTAVGAISTPRTLLFQHYRLMLLYVADHASKLPVEVFARANRSSDAWLLQRRMITSCDGTLDERCVALANAQNCYLVDDHLLARQLGGHLLAQSEVTFFPLYQKLGCRWLTSSTSEVIEVEDVSIAQLQPLSNAHTLEGLLCQRRQLLLRSYDGAFLSDFRWTGDRLETSLRSLRFYASSGLKHTIILGSQRHVLHSSCVIGQAAGGLHGVYVDELRELNLFQCTRALFLHLVPGSLNPLLVSHWTRMLSTPREQLMLQGHSAQHFEACQ